MPRGGKREGAGRPAQSLTDSKQNTPKGINDFKFNVIKEQIDLYSVSFKRCNCSFSKEIFYFCIWINYKCLI